MTPSAASRPDPVGEPDRLADLPHPVLRRAQLLAGRHLAGHLDTSRDAADHDKPCATSRKSASIPSMSGEWNAWLTRSRVVLRPCAAEMGRHLQHRLLVAGDHHRRSGPLSAAMLTSRSAPASSARTSASVAWTATIAPPAGSACISRPRAATSVQASASDSTPATCAAASSPIEWPTRKSGAHAPGLEQPEQRHLDGEQRGLGVPGLVQQRLPASLARRT